MTSTTPTYTLHTYRNDNGGIDALVRKAMPKGIDGVFASTTVDTDADLVRWLATMDLYRTTGTEVLDLRPRRYVPMVPRAYNR